MTLFRRTLSAVLATSIACSGFAVAAPGPADAAQAPVALIGTEQAAAADSHARLRSVLDRADLAAALQAHGVSVDQVRARVDALTDDEAAQLLARIDQLPAGGDVVGVLFTMFVILLVTDILGLTKVFPFTRRIH